MHEYINKGNKVPRTNFKWKCHRKYLNVLRKSYVEAHLWILGGNED